MKQFELVFYPDKQKDFKELDAFVREWIRDKANEYVIARHDAYTGDDYANELHYHYFVHTHADWTLESLAKSLNLEPSQIGFIRKKWKTAILYARHINNTEGKPLIPIECIETNINGYGELCDNALDRGYPDNQRSRVLPPAIADYANNKITRKQLIDAIGWTGYNTYKKEIDTAKQFRSENKLGDNRNMKAIYITGGSGTGKTTLAKFYAKKLGFDFFVTGSGKDPLDGYDNERCIILDDLRGDVFQKSEIFKLLDNNTESRVKSRYFNKVISSCALMIITSINAPDELYDWTSDKAREPFKQFARRLGYGYVFIDDLGQCWNCYYDKDNPQPKKIKTEKAPLDMKDIFAILGIDEKLPDPIKDMMFEISGLVREELARQK